MLRIIISGCNGHMGQVINRMCNERGIEVVAGFDVNSDRKNEYPVYTSPSDFTGEADAVVDFSHASALETLLTFCVERGIPPVICTTGHSPEQVNAIKQAAHRIPVFKSANMSLGINLISSLIKYAATILGDGYDVEIVERHHRRKVDAPSGTALMLADAVASALPYEAGYVYDRQSVRKPRGDHEIGISAVRGGTIVGEHEVIFAGLDEVIEIKHTAYSREVFATGAIRAAEFIATCREPGVYDMSELVNNVLDN